MDPFSILFFDDSDQPQTPERSPSRLDFCMEDLKECDDWPTLEMDWAYTSFNSFPLTSAEKDLFAVDIDPPDHSHHMLDPPPAPSSYNEKSFTPPVPPPHPTVAVEPLAPTPVRSPLVQPQAAAQGYMPPPRTVVERHNYPHHGFSRGALLQQKTLWNSRRAEWAARAEVQTQESAANDAYTGLATTIQPRVVECSPPCMRTPPSGLERDLADHPPRKHNPDVNSSIFPRVGDISALRDPYPVSYDRCFFRYPVWTLHKMLYVFNMNQMSAWPAPSVSAHTSAQSQASMSSPTWTAHTSSTFADDEDSDSTLVADDSPVIATGQLPPEPSKNASPPPSPPLESDLCEWEGSWYTKWEFLNDLFPHDHTKCEALEMSRESTPPLPLLPPAPGFLSTAGEDGEDDEDADFEALISDSGLRLGFEEECDTMAFYGKESELLEMTF